MILSDVLGIRLQVWMGNPIPLPQPPTVTEALTVAEVIQSDEGDGFQLTFTLSKDALTEFPLLLDGSIGLFSRVTVGVLMGVIPQTLINGVITHHQIEPSNEPGQTTLTITGRDVSVMMDLEDRNTSYPNLPDYLIAGLTLARYPLLGLIPQLVPTTEIPLLVQRIPKQAETDLAFLRRLARRNGYVFHVNPVTVGVNQAVFGPEVRVGVPAPAVTMNSITGDNVTALHFSNDGLAASGVAGGAFFDLTTKVPLPVTSLPSLRLPPLTLSPTPVKRKEWLRDTANMTPGMAFTTSVALASTTPEPVTGTGTVDTSRYGSVLQARSLIGVRGVGVSYDGLYYLRQVRHHIEIGKYTQTFTMTREGTVSLTPAVVP